MPSFAITASMAPEKPRPTYFRSSRVRTKDIRKPWLLEARDPRENWLTWMPIIAVSLGLCVSGVLVWDGWRRVINHKYCLVLDENFDGGELNPDIWSYELQTGGWG